MTHRGRDILSRGRTAVGFGRVAPALLTAAATAVMTALGPVSGAAAKEIASFTVGPWIGGAYSDDSGAFDHCAADVDLGARGDLFVFIEGDYSWGFGFESPSWKLIEGRTLNVTFRIDGGDARQGTATVGDPSFVSMPLPADKTLIDQFRNGRVMSVSVGGMPLSLDLSGSSAILDRLDDCVNQYRGTSGPPSKGGSGGSSGAGGIQAGITPPPQPSRGTAPSRGNAPSSGGKLQTTDTGTGFIVTTDGTIVTNNHVVDGCAQVTVMFPGQQPVKAAQLVHDKPDDFALLKAPIMLAEGDIAHLRGTTPVATGEHVAVYGFPLSDVLSSSGNIVDGNISAQSGLNDDATRFQISAPVQPGNSGGPLLDFNGAIIGVVNAKLDDETVLKAVGSIPQNVNFAIKGTVLATFLKSHNVAYKTAGSPATVMDLVGIAAAAQKFTVLVSCQN